MIIHEFRDSMKLMSKTHFTGNALNRDDTDSDSRFFRMKKADVVRLLAEHYSTAHNHHVEEVWHRTHFFSNCFLGNKFFGFFYSWAILCSTASFKSPQPRLARHLAELQRNKDTVRAGVAEPDCETAIRDCVSDQTSCR